MPRRATNSHFASAAQECTSLRSLRLIGREQRTRKDGEERVGDLVNQRRKKMEATKKSVKNKERTSNIGREIRDRKEDK